MNDELRIVLEILIVIFGILLCLPTYFISGFVMIVLIVYLELKSSRPEKKQTQTQEADKELECDCKMFIGGSGKLCPNCSKEQTQTKEVGK